MSEIKILGFRQRSSQRYDNLAGGCECVVADERVQVTALVGQNGAIHSCVCVCQCVYIVCLRGLTQAQGQRQQFSVLSPSYLDFFIFLAQ